MKQLLLTFCLALFAWAIPQTASAQIQIVAGASADTVCNYGNSFVNYTASATGGSGNYVFTWTLPNNTTRSWPTAWVDFTGFAAGTYLAQVCVTDGVSTTCDTVDVVVTTNCAPFQVIAAAWPDTQCVGRTVQFYDSVFFSSWNYSSTYDFGDGNTGLALNGQGVSHTYTTPGTYSVTVTAYDSLRMQTAYDTIQVVIQSTANCPQLSGTIIGPDSVCLPVSPNNVQFYASLQNAFGNRSYQWSMGTQTGTGFWFRPQITTAGTYTVTVLAIAGTDSVTLTKTIVVQSAANCRPSMNVSIVAPDTVCLPTTSNITLRATGQGTGAFSYRWTINGQFTSSRSQFTYFRNRAGVAQVIVQITNSSTGAVGIDTVDIVYTTGGNCPSPQANFGYWPNPACAGQAIFLWDSTGFGGSGYMTTWDMGDGTTYANRSQPSHTYQAAGTYQVTYCLIDTSTQDTFCKTKAIVVNARCYPVVNADSLVQFPDSTCAGQQRQFTGMYSGGRQDSLFGQTSVLYTWDFGDGTTQTIPAQFWGFPSQVSHTYQQPGSYTVTFCVIDTNYQDTSCISTIATVLNTCSDTISGFVYHDVNQNGTQDAGDLPLAGQPVTINPGNNVVFSDLNGYYTKPLAPGTYTVSAPQVNGYVLTSPAAGSYTHTLTASNQNYGGDFGYDTTSIFHDLNVRLFCSTPRPGFDHWVSVYFKNQGTQAVSGSITLAYDAQTVFKNTTPLNNGVHDAVNRTVTWTFTNLAPSNISGRVRAWFTLPANVPLGNILSTTVRIDPLAGDADISNNGDACASIVRGSYDPNDKQVDQDFWLLGDEWLTYTIRFQNTGTDTAFNVEIRDMLDADLDLSTFQMIGASHAYRLEIENGQEAIWKFPNILLPDSNTNLALSQGDLMYRIKPKVGLASGTQIDNTAAIYFDFNAPIITNTTTNSIAFPLSIEPGAEVSKETIPGLEVFPNPATSYVTVKFDNSEAVLHQVVLTDINGKVIRQQRTREAQTRIDTDALPAGVYLLQITSDNGQRANVKLMVN